MDVLDVEESQEEMEWMGEMEELVNWEMLERKDQPVS